MICNFRGNIINLDLLVLVFANIDYLKSIWCIDFVQIQVKTKSL